MLPGPYVQATGAPLVDVELVEDVDAVDFEVADPQSDPLTRLLLHQEAPALAGYLLYPLCPRRS